MRGAGVGAKGAIAQQSLLDEKQQANDDRGDAAALSPKDTEPDLRLRIGEKPLSVSDTDPEGQQPGEDKHPHHRNLYQQPGGHRSAQSTVRRRARPSSMISMWSVRASSSRSGVTTSGHSMKQYSPLSMYSSSPMR